MVKLEPETATSREAGQPRRKKMAVLPPDPLFRFKSDYGHLHTLCFMEPDCDVGDKDEIDSKLQKLSVIDGAVAEQPKKTLLLAAGENGMVYFFDLESNRLIYKQGMGISIQAVHTYQEAVIIQEKQGLVSIFKRSSDLTYEKTTTLPCASGFCKTLRSNHKLIIPQENAAVDIYDLKTHSQLQRLQIQSSHGCKDIPTCLHDAINPQQLGQLMCLEVGMLFTRTSQLHQDYEELIFAGFETGDVFLWNLTSGVLVAHAKFNECIISITYDSIAGKGVVGGAGGVLQVFGVERSTMTMKPLCELTLTNEGCQVVRVRKDRKILVCGGFDGRTRIYSWKTLRLLAALTENHACVTDIQFSEQVVPQWGSQIMAVSGADGVITIWNLYK